MAPLRRDTVNSLNQENYKELLKDYIRSQDEKTLYRAEQLSKQAMKDHISPDVITDMHIKSLQELVPDMPQEIKNGLNFLLETMISYGLAYQEYQSLRESQLELKSEISVAADVQQALLSTQKPSIEGLEIGSLSIPARQMNGDYHQFIKDPQNHLGVAIADIIGKGIPAALCMSMIKYAIDSFPENRMMPSDLLGNLNRVVERNIDPSMFITMFYGTYNPNAHEFIYASAGHEPGFVYRANTKQFREIEAKGLVLGVDKQVTYREYSLELEREDMIILLTDGVTECRQGERFIETDEVLHVIEKYIHLSAQEIVNNVFKHFERLQDFELRDDFTLVILRRNV